MISRSDNQPGDSLRRLTAAANRAVLNSREVMPRAPSWLFSSCELACRESLGLGAGWGEGASHQEGSPACEVRRVETLFCVHWGWLLLVTPVLPGVRRAKPFNFCPLFYGTLSG